MATTCRIPSPPFKTRKPRCQHDSWFIGASIGMVGIHIFLIFLVGIICGEGIGVNPFHRQMQKTPLSALFSNGTKEPSVVRSAI
nr:hypothetical protein [Bacillota bacterium]